MKEYGVKESWVKLDFLHSVATQRLSNLPIAYSKGGQEILVMKHDNPAFVPFCWYNTLDKTLRNTGIQAWPKCLRFVICWRSLFSFPRGKHFGAELLQKQGSCSRELQQVQLKHGGMLVKLQTKWLNNVEATT
ncbi:uncharacterized protein LOC110707631 [Chenopodium quinoa]|uniref:uncharacterized protein LOC110707631 n=1 Tax=Chenopodium quinoa TaxID=63459 RepID=UPI000B77EC11|nr:uncharacterized protein LOC110707631 [Chenopodium quinoa]